MSDYLSQNEIDALLHGVDEGASQVNLPDEFELYDLTSGIHRLQGWAHEVKIVDEHIMGNLTTKFLNLLRESVEIERQELQILKYSEYSKTLAVPSSINTYALTGFVGYSAIVLDAGLVFTLVNIFFGGGARSTKIAGREFSQTEQRVVKLILAEIIEVIKESWKEVTDIEFVPIESKMNPAHLSVYSDSDVLMVRPFKVDFSTGSGEIQLVMPGTVIDSIFRSNDFTKQDVETPIGEILRARAMHYETEITGELSGANLTIGEIFKLSKGDIIPVDSPEKVDVKVNGVTKFKARMGELNNKVGLKILS